MTLVKKFIAYFFMMSAFMLMAMGAFFLGMILDAWVIR